MSDPAPPSGLSALAARFDPQVLDIGERRARVRLEGPGVGSWDALVADGRAALEAADGAQPDALISADGRTWNELARDLRGGM